MKILVIGGSGLIGSQVVANLTELGHEAVPASPSSGVNAVTGEGVADAVAGVDVVVDVANSPSWADDDVMNFFTTSTRNLLEAARAAIGQPLNGITNIAGPDKFGMDDLARIALAAHGDPREVVTDPTAEYFGAVLDDRSIVPLEGPDGEEVTIYETHFNDWAATHLSSATR